MRRAVVSALILLAGSSVVAAPAPLVKGRAERGPSAAQLLEKRRASIAFVRPGMTEAQVTALLGHPSLEIETSKGGSFSFYDDLGITVTFTQEGAVREVQRHPRR
jgi:hypothetical protein